MTSPKKRGSSTGRGEEEEEVLSQTLVKLIDLGNLGILSSETFNACMSHESIGDHHRVCFVEKFSPEVDSMVFAATDQLNASTCTPIYVSEENSRYELKCTNAESGNVVWLIHDVVKQEVCWYSEELEYRGHRVCRYCPFVCPCVYDHIRMFDATETCSTVSLVAHVGRGTSLPVDSSLEEEDDALRRRIHTMLSIRMPLEEQINALYVSQGRKALFEHRCTLDALVDKTFLEVKTKVKKQKRLSSLVPMDGETMVHMQELMESIVAECRRKKELWRAVVELLRIPSEVAWFEFIEEGLEMKGELEAFREHVHCFFVDTFNKCDRLLVFGEEVIDISNLLWHTLCLARELVEEAQGKRRSSVQEKMREKLERRRLLLQKEKEKMEEACAEPEKEEKHEEEEDRKKKKYSRKKRKAEMKKEAAAMAAGAMRLQSRVRRLMVLMAKAKARMTMEEVGYEVRVMARAEVFKEEECAVCFKRFDCFSVLPWKACCSNMLACTSCLGHYKPATCLCGKNHFDRQMWFLAF